MLIALAEGMSCDSEVAAWLSIVVVGVVRRMAAVAKEVGRCNGNCEAARRLAALRSLLQLVSRSNPPAARPDELTEAIGRAFDRGCDNEALERSGVMPSEIAIADIRLLL